VARLRVPALAQLLQRAALMAHEPNEASLSGDVARGTPARRDYCVRPSASSLPECGKQSELPGRAASSWALFFALAVAGCASGTPAAKPAPSTAKAVELAPPRAPAVAVPAVDDGERSVRSAEDLRIVPAVRRELDRVPLIAQHRIAVLSRHGVLTLAGEVNDETTLRAALQAAERVRGVRAIVNRLEVVPTRASDEEIQKNVENALKYDVVTEGQELSARVDDGVVTLEGRVRTVPELEIAEDSVLMVPGVRAVDSRVELTLVERIPDDVIAERIRRRLTNDARMQGARIEVAVENARVSLGGTVGSEFERRIARGDAWMAGVRQVDTTGLVAEPMTSHLRTSDVSLTDAELESAVEDALSFDARITPGSIQVKARNGVVRLDGAVPNQQARLAAQEDALNTVGAREVDNRVRVEPPLSVADYLVEASVEQRLREHPGLTIEDLDVSVEEGKVRLRGSASNNYEKLRAEMAASRVPGVLAVKNELGIAASARSARTDVQLRRDILSELRWDPRVDASRVQVTVENGVATIRGVVPDWESYNAVLENVFEASPARIENRLERAPTAAADREFSFTAPE